MINNMDKMLQKNCEDLVVAWRVLGHLGLVDTIFNHISLATESSDGGFQLLMNPEGILPVELKATQVRRLPLREYDSLEAENAGINPDGLRLHSLIHCARMRPGVIVHTHAPNCVAVGCSNQSLLPLTQTAMELVGELQTVDYDGVFRSQVLSASMGMFATRGGAALLRNHGALTVADTIEEAFYLMYYLEEACRLQVLALSQGVPLAHPKDAAIGEAYRSLRGDRRVAAVRLFQAFSRTIGHEDENEWIDEA
jgi:ribulose-5-phosphate 4-epimerase/fuculose-1-phosphate aldolase